MQAYCMKCRTKKTMKGTKSVTLKNGRPATQGVCSTCGTKMFQLAFFSRIAGGKNCGGRYLRRCYGLLPV